MAILKVCIVGIIGRKWILTTHCTKSDIATSGAVQFPDTEKGGHHGAKGGYLGG